MPVEPFLTRVCRELIHHSDLKQTLVIVPSGRAVYFFKKELQEQFTQTGWMPRIVAVEEFCEEISGYRRLAHEELILETYPVYKSVFGEKNESFRNYLNRVQMLLTDLNDIDSYGEEVHQIFSYLKDERALRLWNPAGSPLTPFQKKYLNFWENLEPFHKKLTRRFDELKGGYNGYVFRKASENTAARLKSRFPEIKEVHWVGFNVFNRCEERIFEQIRQSLSAKIHLDGDSYYLNNTAHEAGRFMRNLIKQYPDHHQLYDHKGFDRSDKIIRTHGVSGEYAVAKTAGTLLQDAQKSEKTALVLADEQLLAPVLSGLPPNVDSVNITMGLPLNNSLFFSFLNALFECSIRARRHADHHLHVKSIMAVLGHPAFYRIFGQTPKTLIRRLTDSQKSFINYRTFSLEFLKDEEFQKDLEVLFTTEVDPVTWFGSVLTVMKDRKNADAVTAGDQIDTIRFEMLLDVMQRTKEYLNRYTYIEDIEDLQKFMNVCAAGAVVPIKGERTDFLQVMGMLETRTLDFDRIVVTSVNEGILPSGKKDDSMIPFEVKRYFGLPTHRLKDAVFAYHFYRLLQHPQKIDLVYDTSKSGLGAAEPSRFIKQLEVEWDTGTLEQYTRNFNQKSAGSDLPAIEKSPEVTAKIREHLENDKGGGLSASALNTYLNSPLDFYLKKVLHIKEPKELEEKMDNSTFGDVVHKTLEDLFETAGSELLTPDHFSAMNKKTTRILENRFEELFKGSRTRGSNYLSFILAEQMVSEFLKNQQKECVSESFYVKEMETHFSKRIKAGGVNCYVHGYPDRIDGFNDRYRVVDYKTGSVNPGDLRIKSVHDLFEGADSRKNDKARQVMFYAWLIADQLPDLPLQTGIYSMKKLKSGFIPLKIEGSTEVTREHIEIFDECLREQLAELLNPDIPLKQPYGAEYTLFT